MHISARPPPPMSLAISRPGSPPCGSRPARLTILLQTWRQRARERRYLAAADHRLVVDLLATGQDASRELERPVWR